MDGILRFSCQLQMQPWTNFVPASHLTPSIKPPLPSMHAHPKPLLSTTFWKQQILPLYTERALKKNDATASFPNSSSVDPFRPLHYNLWSVFGPGCRTFRCHHNFRSVFITIFITFRSHRYQCNSQKGR